MRLVGYKCSKCDTQWDELYAPGEQVPKKIKRPCRVCKAEMDFVKWNFKSNVHRWRYIDGGGRK